MEMNMTTVVSAAIIDTKERKVLLAKRCAETLFPLHWCTPGGVVEDGESRMGALFREIHEELKVWPIGGAMFQLLYKHEREVGEEKNKVTVFCYLIPADYIADIEHAQCGDKTVEIKWFGPDELDALLLTPADDANRETLKQLLLSL